jgi:hypothetical protein
VLCDLSKLENASCTYDDHDHGTSDRGDQKHDGSRGVTVETHEVDRRSLSVFGNENDQEDEKDDGCDDSRPTRADSGGGDVFRSRR